MKKIICGLLLLLCVAVNLFSYSVMTWKKLNKEPNCVKGFADNILRPEVTVPDTLKSKAIKDIRSGKSFIKTFRYGDVICDNGGMLYGGKDDSPKVFKGKIIDLVEIVYDPELKQELEFRDKLLNAKAVQETLRYEEDPTLVKTYGGKKGDLLIAKFFYFKDGGGGHPQCDNFVWDLVIYTPCKPVIEYVVTRDTVRVREEVPCSGLNGEWDIWLNSSLTRLNKRISMNWPGANLSDIERNYNPNLSFDLLGGTKGKVHLNDKWALWAQIDGGVTDNVGLVNLYGGAVRSFNISSNSRVFLVFGINARSYQFPYYISEKYDFVSPSEYKLQTSEYKPWFQNTNLYLEPRIARDKDYVLLKASLDPLWRNNFYAAEFNIEHKLFIFGLSHYEFYRPSKFVATDSMVVLKPFRDQFLNELKIGFSVKEIYNKETDASRRVFIFMDVRDVIRNSKKYQYPLSDVKNRYERIDIGPGIKFPFPWDTLELMLTYVQIKENRIRNYGWCFRFIWDIK